MTPEMRDILEALVGDLYKDSCHLWLSLSDKQVKIGDAVRVGDIEEAIKAYNVFLEGIQSLVLRTQHMLESIPHLMKTLDPDQLRALALNPFVVENLISKVPSVAHVAAQAQLRAMDDETLQACWHEHRRKCGDPSCEIWQMLESEREQRRMRS